MIATVPVEMRLRRIVVVCRVGVSWDRMRVVHKAGSSMAGGVVDLAAPQSASDRLGCVSATKNKMNH